MARNIKQENWKENMQKEVLLDKEGEAMCLGKANGKVVIKAKTPEDVMEFLFSKYKGQDIELVCIPNRKKTFVL